MQCVTCDLLKIVNIFYMELMTLILSSPPWEFAHCVDLLCCWPLHVCVKHPCLTISGLSVFDQNQICWPRTWTHTRNHVLLWVFQTDTMLSCCVSVARHRRSLTYVWRDINESNFASRLSEMSVCCCRSSEVADFFKASVCAGVCVCVYMYICVPCTRIGGTRGGQYALVVTIISCAMTWIL